MKRRRPRLFDLLWQRLRPWRPMFQPGRAARLLSKHDHAMLLSNRGQQ